MCGLFGFLKYGNTKIGVSTLTENLAIQSTVRGTHAAGVAYNDNGDMKIVKQPESALHMDFWFPNINNIVRTAHKVGLRCIADTWGIGKYFGGEQVSLFLQNNIHHRQVSAYTGGGF